MDYVILVVVLATSLTSLPISFVLNKTDWAKDQRFVFAAGAVCLAVAFFVPAWFLRRRYRHVHFIIYVFSMFCWSTCVDFFIALELAGYVKNIMGFYFVEGEPYLNSSHGTMINLWDGTVHYTLQLTGISLFTMQESYREVSLYWCGSIVNSLIVLLYGAVLGNTGMKWSILLNVPYFLLPLIAAFQLFRDKPLQAKSYVRVPPITKRPVDIFFLVFFVLALILAVFRGLAAIGTDVPCIRDYLIQFEPYISDPTAFPKVQMLVYLFYFGFYYVCVIASLLCPGGQLWMADWSIIHAGAAAQAQFSYMAGAFHHRTAANFRPPSAGLGAAVFWSFNCLLLLVPHLFAWRCWRDADNCGRTYTTDVARPLDQPPTRQSVYRTPNKRD